MTATTEPTSFTAGDTVSWTLSLPDYPASAGWVLQYTLINGTDKFQFAAAASGNDHVVTVAAATTATYPAGTYTWQSTVTLGTVRHTVGTGRILVQPNLAAATTLDARSTARKALDAADAALADYGAKAYLTSFSIGGRTQTFNKPGEFLAWRDKLKAEVAREENAEKLRAGISGSNTVRINFTTR